MPVAAFNSSRRSQTVRRATGSSPMVGSSKKSTSGRCMVAWAISSRRIMPPEYVLTKCDAIDSRPEKAKAS